MTRTPHAAHTLTRQVREHLRRNPDSKAGLGTSEPVGDPDGFGVQRSIRFDKTASKWLEKVLPHLGDPRIAGFSTESGRVTVEFVGSTAADFRQDFALADAEVVAESESPSEGSD